MAATARTIRTGARTAPDARMGARERYYSAVLSGSNDRLCQPEGRRRQDDDRGQSGDLSRPRRTTSPDPRSRPPGKRHERLRDRPRRASKPPSMTSSLGDPDLASAIVPTAGRGLRSRTGVGRTCRRRGRAGFGLPARTAPGQGPARRPDRVRLRPARLPAVARAADRECAHRRRLRPDPHPMRVLRPGGPVTVDRHAESRPRQPEPGARRSRASS